MTTPDAEKRLKEAEELVVRLSRERDGLAAKLAKYDKSGEPADKDTYDGARDKKEILLLKERYQALFDHNPLQIFAWRHLHGDFFLIDCNRAANEQTGGHATEFLGQSAKTVYWDKPQVISDLLQCFVSKHALVREFSHNPLGGKTSMDLKVNYTYVPPDLVLMQAEDVTERNRTRGELEKNRRKFEDLVEGMPGIVYSYSEKRGGIYYSARVKDVLGYSPEYLLENPFLWRDSIHPEDLYVVIEAVEEFKRGKPIDVEYRISNSEGRWLWFKDRALSRREMDGDVIVDGFALDVTRRRTAEKEMAESESLLRGIFKAAPVGIGLVELPERTIRWANDYLCVMLGYEKHELEDQNARKLYPDDDEFKKVADVKHSQVREKGKGSVETVFQTKSGELKNVILSSAVRDDYDNLLVFSAEDITERKKAEDDLKMNEERFRSIVEDMPVLVDAMDENGIPVFWNKECERVTGYYSEEIVGNPAAAEMLIPDEDYRTEMMHEMRQSKGYRNWEWEITAKDGSRKIISWTSLTEKYPVEGWSIWGFGMDMTEVRMAEMEVKRSKDRLQALADLSQMSESMEEEIGDFVLQKAIELTGSEMGFINFISHDEASVMPYSYSRHTMEMCSTEVPKSFPVKNAGLWTEALRTRKPFIINDYQKPHARKKGLPGGHAPLDRFLVVPIFDEKEIVIVAAVANKAEDYEQDDVFQVALLMEGLWSRIKRNRNEEETLRSLSEKEMLLKEVHHRVKNNLQIVTSLLDMSGRRAKDGETREILRDMQSKIMAMSLIHNVLYDRQRFDSIEMGSFSRDLLRNLAAMYDPQNEMLKAEFNTEKVYLPLDKAVPCGLAINESLTNVYRHAVSKEKVIRLELELSISEGEVIVYIADNGPGLQEDFDRNTSKLGVKLLKNLIEMQLRGEAKYESKNGTILTMRFPSGRNHYRSRLQLLPDSME